MENNIKSVREQAKEAYLNIFRESLEEARGLKEVFKDGKSKVLFRYAFKEDKRVSWLAEQLEAKSVDVSTPKFDLVLGRKRKGSQPVKIQYRVDISLGENYSVSVTGESIYEVKGGIFRTKTHNAKVSGTRQPSEKKIWSRLVTSRMGDTFDGHDFTKMMKDLVDLAEVQYYKFVKKNSPESKLGEDDVKAYDVVVQKAKITPSSNDFVLDMLFAFTVIAKADDDNHYGFVYVNTVSKHSPTKNMTYTRKVVKVIPN